MPGGDDRDMVTAYRQSPLRGKNVDPHASTRRDRWKGCPVNTLPDHVIDQPIFVRFAVPTEDVGEDGNPVIETIIAHWQYVAKPEQAAGSIQERAADSTTHLRRVFVYDGQALQLALDDTLSYLSASPGTGRHEAVRAQLVSEANNTENQVVMQVLEERVRKGEPFLPELRRGYKPRRYENQS